MVEPWKKIKEDAPAVFGNRIKVTPTYFRNPETGKEQLFPIVTQVRGNGHGSLVIPMTTDGKVVTICEWMQAAGREMQFVPSGVANYIGEPPEKIAERELLEEAGLKAEKIISLGEPFIRDPRNIAIWSHPFLALGCHKATQKIKEDDEVIRTKLIGLEDWIRLACSPGFIEPAVAAATFRALAYFPRDIVIKAIFT